MNEQEKAAKAAADAEAAKQVEQNRAAEAAETERQRAAASAATAAQPAATAEARKAADEAVAAERSRVQTIRTLCRAHKLEQPFEDKLVADGVNIEGARQQVLEVLAKKTSETPVRSGIVSIVTDEVDVQRAGIVQALLHRYDPSGYKVDKDENARQYVGMNLRELTRFCLERRGVNTLGMSVNQMWERTYLSGSDLPNIVLDAANKSLRRAYDSTPRTFVPWTRESSAPDFKNINRIMLSGAPALQAVTPGGEIKRGTLTDGKEVYALSTYARIVGINRQTIINDDMNAFTRVPELCARAAADMESDTVWGIVTTNANLADGVALFASATHVNYTSSGTVISIASLGVGRAAMRVQKGLEGRPINVRPSFLLVPGALEATAEQFTSPAYQATQASAINPYASGGRSALTPICEPRLDANSATAWYLVADPAQIDTIEYAYLEGQQGVYLESRMGWDVDGIEIKVREDFAAKALDYRGVYKNAGA